MTDKIILITGASSGIGKETAKGLAKDGTTIVMACRDPQKSLKALNEIKARNTNANIEVMDLDLASIKSIQRFASEFNRKYSQLHVLINNAGVFCENREETEDGFEKTMGVNYFGLFLLTRLLLPTIKKAQKGRIINVTSKAGFHGQLKLEDIHFKKGYHCFKAYAASKLAVILYTQQLAEELKEIGITVNAVHPGSVATNIWKGDGLMMKMMAPMMKLFSISPAEGAKSSIYLADSDAVGDVSGKLFYKNEVIECGGACRDLALQRALWVHTMEVFAKQLQ